MFHEMSEREHRERMARWVRKLDSPPDGGAKTPEPMRRGQDVRPERTTPRGVYECEIAQAGHRAFHIVNSKGEVGFGQFPTPWVTRGFVRRLMQELERQDRTELHLVKPGA